MCCEPAAGGRPGPGVCREESGGPGKKRNVPTDEKGLPPAIVLSEADTHDARLLEETLNHIVMPRPEPDEKHPQTLCPNAGAGTI